MRGQRFVNGWLCVAAMVVGLLNGCASRQPILVGFVICTQFLVAIHDGQFVTLAALVPEGDR
jgi:hypothetical protein